MRENILIEIRDLLIEVRDLLKSRPPITEGVDGFMRPRTTPSVTFSWDAHLKEKQPKNDYEIIALVVAHLTDGKKKSVTTNEIVEFVRDHPDHVTNTSTSALMQAIYNTRGRQNYQYIEYASKKDKTYCLSIKGKQLVNMLPARMAVNAHGRKKSKSKKTR